MALPYASLFWTPILTVFIGLVLASAFSAIVVYAQELVPGRVGLISGVFFGFAFGMAASARRPGRAADRHGSNSSTGCARSSAARRPRRVPADVDRRQGIRRTRTRTNRAATLSLSMIYRFGTFEFEDRSALLMRADRPVALEPQPARALALLLARAGDVVSRDELRAHLWGGDTHVDYDRGLAYSIGQLRAALGDSADNPRFVQTLPRRDIRRGVNLHDWRSEPSGAFAPIYAAEAARWLRSLHWDTRLNWIEVEAARQNGRLPGLVAREIVGGWRS
jgi:DNA-binding winged helix-turn-helix (wHTH) protein